MSARSSVSTEAVRAEASGRGPSLVDWWRNFVRQKPLGAAGVVVFLFLASLGIFAEALAPQDPNELRIGAVLQPPHGEALLGTDNMGRDILSRVIFGARVSLGVGLAGTALAATVGGLLGLMGAYYGGYADTGIQRLVDLAMAFPMLVLALAIVAALGSSIPNVIVAISFVIFPKVARVVRSSALSVGKSPYVDSARAMGCSDSRIMFVHILPNCAASFIVIATAQLGSAILVEASLSFLGLGVPPPDPSWGSMLSGAGTQYAELAPWMAIFPGVAITLAVLSTNLLGDALRDVWDPRLRQGSARLP